MSETAGPAVGKITWFDLTVEDAGKVRDFYSDVVGWKHSTVDMGGYDDFTMLAPADEGAVAGICHARGTNAALPPQWLAYITVENVDRSAARCQELGGALLVPPKSMGSHGRYCVIRDPAGAVAALFQPAEG